MSGTPIEGKVARILSTRELVINKGASDGVKLGMRFAILDTTGEGIMDPDTREILGSIRRTKVEVEITQLDSRLAVARTFHHRTVNVGGTGGMSGVGALAGMFTPPKYVTRYDTFKLSDAKWEPLSEKDSVVEVGDPVVEIQAADGDEPAAGIIDPAAAKAPPALPADGDAS